MRVSRLAEAVAVLKGCFAEGPFSFAGEHYTITEHDGPADAGPAAAPAAVHRWRRQAGADARRARGGHRRARAADAAATDGGDVVRADPRSITIAATEEKIGWVREAAGDRFDALELNVYPTGSPPMLTDHPRKEAADILDGIRARTGVEVDVDEYLASPQVFIGSVDGLVAKLTELRERLGISSFMVGDVDTLAPVVERLAGT